MAEHRPASGSCARCQASLDLASVRSRGVWYCTDACADGRVSARRRPAVPEPRLYGRPVRHFRPRRSKELR